MSDVRKELSSVTLLDDETYFFEDEMARQLTDQMVIDPTAIASFESPLADKKLKKVKVNIEPVQNLHGYDHPWPGGSGKNLLPVDIVHIKEKNTSGTWSGNTYTQNGVTFTVETDNEGNVIDIKVNGTASATTTFYILSNMQSFFNAILGKTVILNGAPAGGSASTWRMQLWSSSLDTKQDTGNGITISVPSEYESHNIVIIIGGGTTVSNLLFKPMIRLASVTDATFEPYSNICPISGWTGANVTRTGFNQWDEEWEVGKIDGSGQPISGDAVRCKNYISVKGGVSYYLKTGSTELFIWTYDRNKNFIGRYPSSASIHNEEITFPSNVAYIKFRCIDAYGTTYKHDICINFSDPAKNGTYEPGHVVTIPITFPSPDPGTVYGGTLDVTSGVLTVDRAQTTLNGGVGENWLFYDGLGGTYHTRIPNMKSGNAQNGLANWIKTAQGTAEDLEIRFGANDDKIYCYGVNNNIPSVSDISSWKTFLALNNLIVVYPLASPQTYQLTPTEITTLLGENNLLADTGDISVIYGAYLDDSDEQIEKLESVRDVTALDSSAIATFEVDIADMPLKECKVNIESVQNLHGYDHPWPGGGGVNKCNMENVVPVSASASYGLTVTKDVVNETITIAGTPTWSSEGTKNFRIYGYPNSYDLYKAQFYVVSKSANITSVDRNGISNTGENTVTISITVSDTADISLVVKPLLYDKDATAPTAYSPYSNICPISGWTGANIANISDSKKQPFFAGLLNGTYGFVDLGTLTYSSNGQIPGGIQWRTNVVGKKYGIDNIICPLFTIRMDDVIGHMSGRNNSDYVMFNSSISTANDFKAAMSGVYLIYELATPTTPTITKEQFDALLEEFGIGGWLVPISY